MAWTLPRTWTNGEVVGETEMNAHVRDNLSYLFSPAFQQLVTGSAGLPTAPHSASATAINTGLVITVTTYGGNVEAFFQANITGSGRLRFNLQYDGTALVATATGITIAEPTNLNRTQVMFHVFVTGLASGSHTFAPMFARVGPSLGFVDWSDAPAVFWVRGH